MKQLKCRQGLFILTVVGMATFFLNPAQASDSDSELAGFFSEIPAAPPSEDLKKGVINSLEPAIESISPIIKKKKFAGWGPYTKNIKLVCAALARDGRAVEFVGMAEKQIVENPICLACNPLYKILAKTCRPAKIKKSKVEKKNKEENTELAEVSAEPTSMPTPEPTILQREPSVELQVAIQLLLNRLEEDPKRVTAGQEAVYSLAKVLLAPNKESSLLGKSDYFAAVSELLVSSEAPPPAFTKVESDKDDIQGLGPDNLHIGVAAPANIDELFN